MRAKTHDFPWFPIAKPCFLMGNLRKTKKSPRIFQEYPVIVPFSRNFPENFRRISNHRPTFCQVIGPAKTINSMLFLAEFFSLKGKKRFISFVFSSEIAAINSKNAKALLSQLISLFRDSSPIQKIF